jgi:hypothetical protein
MVGCDTLSILYMTSIVKYVDDTLFSDFLRVCDMAHSLYSEAMFPIAIDHRTLSHAWNIFPGPAIKFLYKKLKKFCFLVCVYKLKIEPTSK